MSFCKNFNYIWNKGIPFKISFFILRLWKQRLPIGEVLVRNKMCDGVVCCCCEDGVQETIEHFFFNCASSNYV